MKDHKTRQIRKNRLSNYKQGPHDRHHPYNNNSHRHYSTWKKRTDQIQLRQINRKQQCPFLVRVFYAINDENNYYNNLLPEDKEVKLHLWLDSTLRQVTEWLRIMLPSVRSKHRYTYWILRFSKDKKKYQKIEMDWVYENKRPDKHQDKQLRKTKFQIGDMIDVSICYK